MGKKQRSESKVDTKKKDKKEKKRMNGLSYLKLDYLFN